MFLWLKENVFLLKIIVSVFYITCRLYKTRKKIRSNLFDGIFIGNKTFKEINQPDHMIAMFIFLLKDFFCKEMYEVKS